MNTDYPTIIRNTKITKERLKTEGTKVVKKTNNNTGFDSLNSGKKINDSDDLPKQEKVGRNIGLRFEQARLAKGLKQADFAKSISMPLALYQTYEKGTAVKNGLVLQQLATKLGVVL
jgi:ribosome-binding protein aMBF1 (putative translation factor)